MGGDRKEVDIESDPDDPKETSDKEKSNEGKDKHNEQIEETTKVQCEVHKTKKERYEEYCKWKKYGDDYTCRYCYKDFAHKRSCKVHQNTMHRVTKNFQCKLCEKAFTDIDSLKFHKKKKHSREEYIKHRRGEIKESLDYVKCVHCFKMVLRNNMKRHISNVHGFPCSSCGKKFSNATSLNYHKVTKHMDKFECNKCEKKFDVYKEYLRHRRVESGREEPLDSVKCKFCEEIVSTKNMRRHTRIVHRHALINTDLKAELVKPFKCEKCNRFFSRKDNLKTHIDSIHSGLMKTKYSCKICSETFSRSYNLKIHIACKHSSHQASFKCQICDKTFTKKGNLKQHNTSVKCKSKPTS
jgi:KRAB domain-containing zinc finger protein